MGSHGGKPGPSDLEYAATTRQYRFQELAERIKKIPVGMLTVEEMLLIACKVRKLTNRYSKRVTIEQLEILERAVLRIEKNQAAESFRKIGKKGHPYDASQRVRSHRSVYDPNGIEGRNHI